MFYKQKKNVKARCRKKKKKINQMIYSTVFKNAALIKFKGIYSFSAMRPFKAYITDIKTTNNVVVASTAWWAVNGWNSNSFPVNYPLKINLSTYFTLD